MEFREAENEIIENKTNEEGENKEEKIISESQIKNTIENDGAELNDKKQTQEAAIDNENVDFKTKSDVKEVQGINNEDGNLF